MFLNTKLVAPTQLLDFCENMEKMDQRETLLQAFDARNPFCDCVTTFGMKFESCSRFSPLLLSSRILYGAVRRQDR